MLNFTVGPVMSGEDVTEVASHSTPYFRTTEFSGVLLENERMLLEMLHAPEGSRCVFLTCSGTGAMESMVMNILNDRDRVIIVNGGSFGQRFVELAQLHGRDFTEVKCEFGRQLRRGAAGRSGGSRGGGRDHGIPEGACGPARRGGDDAAPDPYASEGNPSEGGIWGAQKNCLCG